MDPNNPQNPRKRFNLGDILRKARQDNEPAPTPEPLKNVALPQSDERLGMPDGAASLSDLPDQPYFGTSQKASSASAGARLGDSAVSGKVLPLSAISAPPPLVTAAPSPVNTMSSDSLLADQGSGTKDSEEGDEFDIYRYLSIIYRRKWIIGLSTIVATIIALYTYATGGHYYTANARVLFNPNFHQIISDNMVSFEAYGSREKKFRTHLDLLKTNKDVISRVSDAVGGGVSPSEIEAGIVVAQGNTNGDKNDIINVSFSHRDPMMARDVVNNLVTIYTQYILEVNAQDITQMVMKFETQMDKVKSDLREKEDALRYFKEENRMVEMSQQSSDVMGKLSAAQGALQQTDFSINENTNRLESLKKEINLQEQSTVESVTYADPYRKKLGDLEFELNTITAEYGPDHFKVKMLKNEIEHIKELLRSNVNKTVENETYSKNPIREQLVKQMIDLTIDQTSLEGKRKAYQEQLNKMTIEMLKLPALEQRYLTMQRETQSLIALAQMLQDQYEKIKLKRDSQESDLKILELAATPRVAITNVKKNRIWTGLFVGLLIGIALAFLLEFLDQTIKEARDVERVLEVPLLGVLPFLEGDRALLEFDSKKGKNKLEPFRSLRANLKHIAAANNIKTFMVCSAVKGEGKTTMTVNMAIAFAMDGKRIVIIDGDLRRPQVHALLGLKKDGGLSDYLINTMQLEDIIKTTKYDNLFAITSGERPHNPTELLGTVRFEQIINDLKDRFDFVLLDSPALLPVSDTVTMAPKIQAILMVTRTLWTPIRAARHARNQLKQIGSTVMGAILNGVSHSRGYYPYYYGYYRYYAYKYTYDYEEEHTQKSTFREFGLSVEEKVREALMNIRGSLPRYVQESQAMAGFVFSKKRFWILAGILVALMLSSPWLKIKKAQFSKQTVLYLDKKGGAKENIKHESAIAITPSPTKMRALKSDSLSPVWPLFSQWQSTMLGGQFPDVMRYYDSLMVFRNSNKFAWMQMCRDSIMPLFKKGTPWRIETAQIDPVDDSTQVSYATFVAIAAKDTSRLYFSQVWNNRQGWYITRQRLGMVK